MRGLLLAVCLIAIQVTAQPNCEPAPGVSFSNMPVGHCPNIVQVFNGAAGQPYNFDFNWCQTAVSSSCPPSYIVQGGNNVCDRGFIGWTSGMTYAQNVVSYTVNDGAGSTGTISITCDPNGQSGTIGCPSQYNVVGADPQFAYTIALTSKNACPGGAGPPGPPGSGDDGSSSIGGTVFLILFFVGGALYAGIGFAYGFKVLGLTGVEAFPNIAFWRDFPALLGDGCGFFVAKVKGLAGGGSTYTPV